MSGLRLGVFLTAVAAVLGGLSVAKGGLYITMHEVDTVHLVDAIMRMAEGQVPHLDFMMPIGILALFPILAPLGSGADLGQAMLISQALVALLLLPALWWTALSRFPGPLGYAFGAVVLVFVFALVFGTTGTAISFSLHYNRWCWAFAFIVVALAAVDPSGPRRPVLDGVLLGLLLSVFALMKVTYFAALALPVALALILRREVTALLMAAVSGLLVAAIVTLVFGFGYWMAYLDDLLIVASSEVRPGHIKLTDLLSAPVHLGASMVALAAVVLLRQAGARQEGLILLLLLPAFVYISYQNFGNNPVWLVLLGLLVLRWSPSPGTLNRQGWDMRSAAQIVAAVAFALTAPLILNMAHSPIRNFNTDVAKFVSLIPGGAPHNSLQIVAYRVGEVLAETPLQGIELGRGGAVEKDAEEELLSTLLGEAFPDCSVTVGSTAWMERIALDVARILPAGTAILAADVVSSYWLYTDLDPLPGGAPWYYGGAPGFENADHLVVPLCPVHETAQRLVIDRVFESGAELVELERTDLFILVRIDRAASVD